MAQFDKQKETTKGTKGVVEDKDNYMGQCDKKMTMRTIGRDDKGEMWEG